MTGVAREAAEGGPYFAKATKGSAGRRAVEDKRGAN